ncbi:uncharacterized protein At4g13200, chloroplastic [Neltuma alba]|uniref:uncharacterized protein At4g13200, chloroplastic n=1 Tax=Neltuma alba TaxID=207710 RepID=UPI0010A4615B|nr:uncharacterized protein At4g13200, chloroplastic-like [Prosopis alba]
MMSGASPSAPPAPCSCSLSKPQLPLHLLSWNSVVPCTSSCPKLKGFRFASKRGYQNIGVRCNSSIWPGGPGSGDSDSRSILDAFFLGKALAEAVNERIESTVGEFLSTVGRAQAEQRKQVQDFQDEVLERAKKAKEKAAREAMESQGLISESSADREVADYAATRPSYSATETVASVQPSPPDETTNDPEREERPALNSSTDD